MRLSIFIQQNMEPILQDWEDFAKSIQPPHRAMDTVELRDHAEEMLREIAEDLNRPQAAVDRLARSRGQCRPRDGDSAAQIHATQRLMAGFTVDQLVAEYRALRASVLHLWANRTKTATWFEVDDMTCFNEALDQALAESVARYSAMVDQAQDIFIGILSHDIRTPLNAISIGAETLMRTESLDGKHIQLASRIFNSSERIAGLVDDLLDFTKARFGMQLSLGTVNIGLLAEQVIEELRAAHPERTILLDACGDLRGTWDSGRTAQVISNLVSNALQHGSTAEPVSVSLIDEANMVTLCVHNAGEPIPKEEIGHIFEPLRRYARTERYGDAARSHLGLGLYIAREVVHAQGGTINVVSDGARGTTFTVRLPRTREAAN